MDIFNKIMAVLMMLTILVALFKGEHFLALSYRKRLIASIIFASVFGGWIVAANIVK